MERDLSPPEPPRSRWGRLKRRFSAALGGLLLWADLAQLSALARRATRDRSLRFWIGVDLLGAAVASRSAPGGRFAYWSLELVFADTLTDPTLRRLKRRERRFSRRARPVIVQDPQRAALLCRENGIDEDRVVLVPNAPRGAAPKHRSSALRERLGLGDDIRIILHLGMMGPEVLSRQIAAAARDWPADWRLVFHERYARTADDPVVREAADAGGERVAFSLEPVKLDELPGLVASADVGLVFYNPDMGENFSVITGASGKLAFYLQAGLPVICLDLPGFAELVGEHGCGLCVNAPDEIGSAVRRILADPEPYRSGARRCFEARFAFDATFAPVLEHIGAALDEG